MCKVRNEFENIIAVTNRALCTVPFLEQVERVCAVHPKALLLREKDLSEEEYTALAKEVLPICAHYGVMCILHFYPGAANALGNQKLHLPLAKLRELYASDHTGQYGTFDSTKRCGIREEAGRYEILGCSVHSVAEAKEARRLGATYLTAGHIYATDCKRGVPPRGLSFLREICAASDIPVYAIGGIGMESAGNTDGADQGKSAGGMDGTEQEKSAGSTDGAEQGKSAGSADGADRGKKRPCAWQMREIADCGAKGACIMSGMMRL